jgi:DHA1 family multidrug resistance protein-like MFS transporter
MTFVGPALGPVIGGFLELKKDWRWVFYVLLWMVGLTEILMFTIPETHPPRVLMNKARRIRSLKIPGFENVQTPAETSDRSLISIFKIALIRPWQILVDPISLLVAIYLSVVYALLYMLFTIYRIVFQQKRGWNAGVGELPLIGTAIGATLGGCIIFLKSAQDKKNMMAGIKIPPEDRLIVAMIGGVLFPVTMFWFAWTAQYNSIHWAVPTIAGVFLATSIQLIFVAYLNYLTDSYLMFAASAIAANTITRSAAGAAAPLFTQYMFDALGVGGGGSLIGGVATLLAPIPFIFYKYGGPIRKRSKFAPTPDDDHTRDEPGPGSRSSSTVADDSDSSHTASRSPDPHGDEPMGQADYGKDDGKEVETSNPLRTDGLERDIEKGKFDPIGGLD